MHAEATEATGPGSRSRGNATPSLLTVHDDGGIAGNEAEDHPPLAVLMPDMSMLTGIADGTRSAGDNGHQNHRKSQQNGGTAASSNGWPLRRELPNPPTPADDDDDDQLEGTGTGAVAGAGSGSGSRSDLTAKKKVVGQPGSKGRAGIGQLDLRPFDPESKTAVQAGAGAGAGHRRSSDSSARSGANTVGSAHGASSVGRAASVMSQALTSLQRQGHFFGSDDSMSSDSSDSSESESFTE